MSPACSAPTTEVVVWPLLRYEANAQFPCPPPLSSRRTRPDLSMVHTTARVVLTLRQYYLCVLGRRLCYSASPSLLDKGLS